MTIQTKRFAIQKSEVLSSALLAPTTWFECVEVARNGGFRYVAFKGMVFKATEQNPVPENSVCLTQELLDG